MRAMTPEELVEAVAEAMRDERRAATGLMSTTPSWGALKQEFRDDWLNCARAALRVVRDAMAEPDDAMRAACRATTGAIITRKHCDEMWQGMLAAHPISRIEE